MLANPFGVGACRFVNNVPFMPGINSFGFTSSELRTLRALKTPAGIQKFLDELPYNLSYTARSPKKVLHDRTAFEDFLEPERKRHLLRLWVAPPSARPLPEVYAERFGSVTPGDRGGIAVKGSRATIPFDG